MACEMPFDTRYECCACDQVLCFDCISKESAPHASKEGHFFIRVVMEIESFGCTSLASEHETPKPSPYDETDTGEPFKPNPYCILDNEEDATRADSSNAYAGSIERNTSQPMPHIVILFFFLFFSIFFAVRVLC